MFMVDAQIRKAIQAKDIRITPFSPDGIGPISYAARIGKRGLRAGQEQEHDLEDDGDLILEAGEFVLFQTLEKFNLCDKVSGHLSVHPSIARRGLVLLAGMHIEPGWDGHLILGGYNAFPNKLALEHGIEVASIQFNQLRYAPKRLARESPEQRRGRFPRMDKDYLCMLETHSLSDLERLVRDIAQTTAQRGEEGKRIEAATKVLVWVAGVTIAVAATTVATVGVLQAMS